MYILNDLERQLFVATYFSVWGDDIKKVTLTEYNDRKEYLLNDHYLFCIDND